MTRTKDRDSTPPALAKATADVIEPHPAADVFPLLEGAVVNAPVLCPVCYSTTPESEARLREITRYGLARLLNTARRVGVQISPEQQREVLQALVEWDPADAPGAVDWLVHEHALRGAALLECSEGVSEAVADALVASGWDSRQYNCEAEQRIADQLMSLR